MIRIHYRLPSVYFIIKSPLFASSPQFHTDPLSFTPKSPQFHTPPISTQKTSQNWRVCLTDGCVELRAFWCGTEWCVEMGGFRCGTEGFPVLNRGVFVVKLREFRGWKGVALLYGTDELTEEVWKWGGPSFCKVFPKSRSFPILKSRNPLKVAY